MIKSQKEIEKMKVAGQLAAETLEMIDQYVKEGVSTGELDDICHDFIVNEINCIPACLNYKGYPKTICTSINQVICHGIPDHKKILKDGDIMNIDVTVIKDGYHGDTSKMYFIGNKKPHAERLVRITQESMDKGILSGARHSMNIHISAINQSPKSTSKCFLCFSFGREHIPFRHRQTFIG